MTLAVAVERSAAAATATATAPAGSQSAAAGIDDLTGPQKLDFVLAVLDARDKSLANLSYRLREEQWATSRATGARKFQSRDEYEFRRLDATFWMHLTHYAWGQSTKIATESIFSWNGKVSRGIGFPPYVGTAYHHGRIEPDEDDVYTTYRFNELLGLKVANWGDRK